MATKSVAAGHRDRKRRLHLVAAEPVLADDRPLIKPGEYVATATGWEKRHIYQVDKVYVFFTVFVDGLERPEATVTLPRHYRVTFTPNGFRVPSVSDYAREWTTVTERKPKRLDRLSPSALKKRLVRVVVRTVDKDHKQHDLHPLNQYSVIDRIVGVCR